MAYLTRVQAMERLHVGSTKLWTLTANRRIPFYQDKPNGKMLFDEADIERYLAGMKVTACAVRPNATLRKRRA